MPRVARYESVRPAPYALPKGVPALQSAPFARRARWAAAGLAVVVAAVAGFFAGRRAEVTPSVPKGVHVPAGGGSLTADPSWR